jgi:hypothetical protein
VHRPRWGRIRITRALPILVMPTAFANFGDADGFRQKINAMKDGVKIEGAG